jgi:hypothetical protein
MSVDYGIKSSKPTFDVNTAADKNLSFTSKMRSIMVRAKGIATSASFNFAHGLGYSPSFAGYIVDTGKYFPNYFITPLVGYLFANTMGYGDIYTDTTNLHCEHASANRLVYVCYVNPADSGANPTSIASVKDFGIKISQTGKNVKTAKDGELVLSSKFQSPLIILQDSITVNVAAISAGPGVVKDQSDFTDYAHGRAQANHFLMPDFYGAGLINFATEPIGFIEPYVFEEHEVYIDATNIRYRVSRRAAGSVPPFPDETASAAAKTVTIKFFLTNITLPT